MSICKCILGKEISVGQTHEMAPPRKTLTAKQRRAVDRVSAKLRHAEEAVSEARREWASVISELPQAPVARQLGITRQAVAQRLRNALKNGLS
jgi:hypothetical protein